MERKYFKAFDEQNNYIVEELQDRLRYVDKYQLYNNKKSKYGKVIKGLLNKYSKDLKLYAKYLFISSEGFPKDKIKKIVEKQNINKEEYVVL